MSISQVYLIPTPLYPEVTEPISEWTKQLCLGIKHFYVENVRTARRVLKKYNPSVVIDEISFEEVNHRSEVNLQPFYDWIKAGHPIGIMSEAGMPAVADPGHILVAKAHELGIKVMPVTGPNSIILALCASGFNGQAFTFHGYLPIQSPELSKKLTEMDSFIKKGYTQIFIETPFRNMAMMKSLTDKLPAHYKLCIACDITGPEEYIKTQSIKEWKSILSQVDLHKRPCIFLVSQ